MNPYAEPLAWALVNFVWQGAALALAAFLVIRWVRPSAGARYATGVVTLALMLAAPVVTFAVLARTGGAPAQATASNLVEQPPAGPTDPISGATEPSASQSPRFATPAVVLVLWLSGVAVFSLRLLGGWVVARRMVTRAVRPVAPEIAVLARRVAARLALDRVVRIVESSTVSVPVMVGWLKPVVLLPAVALSGLSPTQLEALLAHELAHVRRHDYLVNLLQSAVETLLFYHPAVWWVSKQVRAEREHCCDDLVVGVCDRVIYVSALTDLATMSVPRTALAATDGSLLTRVRRILGRTESGATAGGGWVSIFVALLVVGAIAPMAVSQAPGKAAGGVVGGVPGGVAGGVPGSVAVIQEQATTSAEQARQRELEAAAARRQAAEAELRSLDQERVGLDRMKVEEAMKQQRAVAEADLTALGQEYERAKRLFDIGLLSGDALAAIEARMHQAELKVARTQRELNLRVYELAMGEREAKVRQMMEARVVEYEKARQATEAIAAVGGQDQRRTVEARDRRAQLERQLEELIRRVRGQREENLLAQRRARETSGLEAAGERARDARLMANTAEVTDLKEPIRTGDILTVDITGETELLRTYVVQADGTIRLPIVGSIKVVGLTAPQAGQAITKQMTRA